VPSARVVTSLVPAVTHMQDARNRVFDSGFMGLAKIWRFPAPVVVNGRGGAAQNTGGPTSLHPRPRAHPHTPHAGALSLFFLLRLCVIAFFGR
jgi:hypothetical protein